MINNTITDKFSALENDVKMKLNKLESTVDMNLFYKY